VPSEEEIKTIIDLWNQDKSYGEIAKSLNGKKSTIQSWIEGLIKKGEIEPRTNGIRTNTKNATLAKKNYDRAARIDLNNYLFDKVCNMSKVASSTSDLKNLIISFGILTDKREIIEPSIPEPTRTKLDSLIDLMEKNDSLPAAQTGASIPRLPEDSPNPDVRVGQERQDGDSTVLQLESS
jgi:predicted transcriptional regulator